MSRPPVSVIVPFHGDDSEAEALLAALDELRVTGSDELLVVDNTESSVVPSGAAAVRVIAAPGQQSSYYARNVGAEQAVNDWLLFVDSDCRPAPGLLESYFEPPPGERCGVVAGGVRGAGWQTAFVTAWARSRGHVGEAYHVEHDPMPAGITANLLVRREAWAEVGGFHEGIRSGGDVEFCWRLQEVGWEFAHRPAASLEHVHVESLRALLRKGARYGAGRTWIERRYPGSAPRPKLWRELSRALAGGIGFTLAAQPRRGAFKLVDGAWYAAVAWGHLFGENRARRDHATAGGPLLAAWEFPAGGDAPAPPDAWIEAVRRPRRVERSQLRARVTYIEDDPPGARLRAFAWLIARHPVRALGGRADGPGELSLIEAAPVARRAARGGASGVSALNDAAGSLVALISRLTGAATDRRD